MATSSAGEFADPLTHFLRVSAAEIERRAALTIENHRALLQGAAQFSNAVEAAESVTAEPTTVGVVETLVGRSGGAIFEAAIGALDQIRWVASHRLSDGGSEAALAPLNDTCRLDGVQAGLLLLGPGCRYPEHSHPPQELYLPITRGGSWRYGGSPEFRELSADALVYNNPNDVHAVEAARDAPLLALYVLWPMP